MQLYMYMHMWLQARIVAYNASVAPDCKPLTVFALDVTPLLPLVALTMCP